MINEMVYNRALVNYVWYLFMTASKDLLWSAFEMQLVSVM